MPEIQSIHENVFLKLQQWRNQSRHGYHQSINPFFYLRSVRDERFRRGFWFPGNEHYLCISFWSGGDSFNKTPNVYFEINKNTGCHVIITSKDSEIKTSYFSKLIDHLNQGLSGSYSKKGKQWKKTLSQRHEEYESLLQQFIDQDKALIDRYIYDYDEPEHEEYAQRFGFIEPTDFDKFYSRVVTQREELIQSEQLKKQQLLSRPHLPLSINKITIENFQGIKACSVSELPLDSNWMFITGENGYGKTSILQAIAIGLNENPDLEKYLDRSIFVELDVYVKGEKDLITRRIKGLSKALSINYEDYIIGYGPARLNVQAETSENIEARGRNPIIGLFEYATLLKNINYELFTSNIVDRNLFGVLQDIIRVITKERIDNIEVDRDTREVLFTEKLTNGQVLTPLPISKLAAGFRNIINLVFDMFMRFKAVHNSLDTRAFFGIVLIDEIENHLHPILQREIIETLTQVFPNVFFIATTHSPIPLLGAPKNTIILTVNRTVSEGVVIERLDEKIDFPNLLPNTILTSPVFGFHDLIPISHESNESIRAEQTFPEIVENDLRREKINSYLSEELKDEMLKLLKK